MATLVTFVFSEYKINISRWSFDMFWRRLNEYDAIDKHIAKIRTTKKEATYFDFFSIHKVAKACRMRWEKERLEERSETENSYKSE